MSLSKTLYPLLRIGPTQEDLSLQDRQIVDWDVKNQTKQTKDSAAMNNWCIYVTKYLVSVEIHFPCCSSLKICI